jgi:hypothetical protein
MIAVEVMLRLMCPAPIENFGRRPSARKSLAYECVAAVVDGQRL